MKKFFIALLILILLPIVTSVVFLWTFDLNNYRHWVETELSKSLHYPVQIDSMATKLSLIPTVQIVNFKILTAEKDQIIMNVPSMEAVIEVVPLIKKQVIIQKINIPVISIDLTKRPEKTKTNAKQDSFKTEEKKPAQTISAKKDLSGLFWVESIQIGKMFLFFQQTDKKELFTIEDFDIKKLANFETKFTYNNTLFNLSGTFGTLTDFLGDKNTLPIDLKIRHNTNSVYIKGQIGDLKQMSKIRLDVTAMLPSLSKFLVSLGLPDFDPLKINITFKSSIEGDLKRLSLKKISISGEKDALLISGEGMLDNITQSPRLSLKLSTKLTDSVLSRQLHLNPFELSNKLNFSAAETKVYDIKYQANRSELTGDITINSSLNPPNVQFNLNSLYLSLKDIFYQDIEKKKNQLATKKKPIKSLSKTRLPWDIFPSWNLNGQIQIASMNLSDLLEEYVSLNVRPILNNGILTAPIQIRFANGSINNILRLNQADKTIQLKSEVKDIDLGKVRRLNKSLTDTTLDADISFQTKGVFFQDLLANSQAHLLIEIIGGKIINPWFNHLAEILNEQQNKTAFATTQKDTDILCGALNLNLDKGILTSQNQVALQTNVLNLILNGEVNLNNKTLKVALTPSRSNTSNQLTDILQMVTLSGPWSDLQLGLDTQQILPNLVKQGIEKATNKQVQSTTFLCEKALGRPVTKPKKKQKIEENKSTPLNEPAKTKVDLKEQLLRSLSQVLLKKAQ